MHERFEPFEEVGRGPIGVVHRGLDLDLGREVAIKALYPAVIGSSRMQGDPWAMLRRLADPQAVGDHSGLSLPLSVDPARGWVVSEYLPTELRGRQPTSPAVVASLLVQTLDALRHLHEHAALIHGSIQPRNLRIDARGLVRLTDARGVTPGEARLRGLPWLAHELDQPPGADEAGLDRDWLRRRPPARYRAPELFEDRLGPIGPGVDLYGLGLVGFELLVGKRIDDLVPGSTIAALRPADAWHRWHLAADLVLPDVRYLIPDTPEPLARVIHRLAAKPLDRRFATAAEAIDALGDIGRPRPIRVGAPKPGSPARSTPRPASPAIALDGHQVVDHPGVRDVGRLRPARPAPPRPAGFREIAADVGQRALVAVRTDRRAQIGVGVLVALLMVSAMLAGRAAPRYTIVVSGRPADAVLTLVRRPKAENGLKSIIKDNVRLDRVGGGQGSAKFENLEAGAYVVKAKSLGHEPREFAFDVGPEFDAEIDLKALEPRLRPVRLAFEPPVDAATIVVSHEGQAVDLDRLELPVELDSKLEIRAPGFKGLVHELTVPDSVALTTYQADPIRLDPLPPEPVKVILVVEPAEAVATLKVDDEAEKLAFSRPPGLYSMHLESAGFRPFASLLEIDASETGTKHVPISLERVAPTRDVVLKCAPKDEIVATIRIVGGSEESISPNIPRTFKVGERLVVSYRVDGLQPDTLDLVVEAGEGVQEVPINPLELVELSARTLPMQFSRLARPEAGGLFVGGMEETVLRRLAGSAGDEPKRFVSPIDRRDDDAGVDDYLPSFLEQLQSENLFHLELQRAGRFRKKVLESKGRLDELVAPSLQAPVPTPDVFFSTRPITWRLWRKVLGFDRLPEAIRLDFERRADHPAVGLTDEECLIFCRVLSDRLRSEGLIDRSWEATPPTRLEMCCAEKGGWSHPRLLPTTSKERRDGRDDFEARIAAATRDDLIVRSNIRAYKRGPGARQSVHIGRPNGLGIVLGQVMSRTVHPYGERWHYAAGPNFHDRAELLAPSSWPSLLLAPTQFNLSDLATFYLHLDRGWAPGDASLVGDAERLPHVGLYVVLRPTTGTDASEVVPAGLARN